MLQSRARVSACSRLLGEHRFAFQHQVTPPRPQVLRRRLNVSAQAETDGVQRLLARDTSSIDADTPSASSAPPSTTAPTTTGRSVLKTKRQRRKEMAKMEENASTTASEAEQSEDSSSPKRCGQALNLGLQLFEQKKYSEAIEMFSVALELPGNGAYRLPGTPREFSCPSDAEENAALYNMACAYAQLQQGAAAMTCLEAVLENGFEDFETIRTDADLAPCGTAQLDALLSKYDNPFAKMQKVLKGPDRNQSDTNKPWLLW